MNEQTYNLGPYLLGPDFSTQTPDSFYLYVESLKLERSIGKEKKVKIPRVKKPTLIHSLDAETKRCLACLVRPKNPEAKCAGKPKSKAKV